MDIKRKIGVLAALEEYGPLLIASTTFLLISFYTDELHTKLSEGWSLSNLYSAIFGWAGIQTGFVFGVYGFIAAKPDGFVRASSRTIAMKKFISYTRQAMSAGFLISVISIPLMVASPSLKLDDAITFIAIQVWFSLFCWAFCGFLRVAYIFGIIVRAPQLERIPG